MTVVRECMACHEKRGSGEVITITAHDYWCCDDCCRKLTGVIEGNWL